MGNLIRRNKAVPVEARRVQPPIDRVNIPGVGPAPIASPVPPPTPGVTQNIIYVNVPAGQTPPPQQPPPAPVDSSPREVHFHNTNVYNLPHRRRSGRGVSFLGTLGFVLGGVAIGAAYLPQVVWLARPIAMGGFVCAGLGLLGAMLLDRAGRGMPMLGLMVCAAAYALWLKNTGQPIAIPKLDFNISPAQPAPPPATPVSPTAPAAPPVKPAPPQDRSIFGTGMGEWVKPSPAAQPATPANQAAPPPASAIDAAAATDALENARMAAAARMGIDYSGAKSAAADADAKYQQAKIDDAPGSAELIAASQQHLQADSQLNLIKIKLRADPAVAAAEKLAK